MLGTMGREHFKSLVRRICSGLDMQKIGKATELKRKRRLPSSDEEEG
jgi:hypothetical protein